MRESMSPPSSRLMLVALVASCNLPPSPGLGAEAVQLTLTKDGRSACTIVVAQKPTRAAQLAAYELQYHVRLMTSAKVAITKKADAVEGTRILVGPSMVARGLGIENQDLGPQEYLIRFSPGAIALMGRDKDDFGEVKYSADDPFVFRTWPDLFDEQGTLYAVYDFLERFCDVRWLSPTEVGMDFRRIDTLIVRGNSIRRRPAFRYRDLGWVMGMSENYDAATSLWPRESAEAKVYEAAAYPDLHHRFPGRWQYIHAKRGRARLFLHRMRLGGEKYRANHSFYGYYDRFWEQNVKLPDLFVEKRPEWFARGQKGRPPQMCYTNAELVQQVIQDARGYFDGKGLMPRAVACGDFFALVPMDNSSYCKCDTCRTLYNKDEEACPHFSNGRWSDYVFGFANEVAKAVKQSHPDKYLATLAYASYARYPKRTRLEDNLAVQLCLHVRNTYDRSMQANDLEILNSWASKEKDRPIYLWLYYCFPAERGHRGGWHVFPGFFAHQIAQSFKLYHRLGIRGAFFNGSGQDVDNYVTFRHLDDPSRDIAAVLDEFFGRYYGAAAEPMKRFYLMVEETYSNPENYPEPQDLRSIGHQTEEMAWRYLGTPARMEKLEGLVTHARSLASSSLEKRRIELFEKGVWDYMRAGPRRTTSLARTQYPETPARVERILFREPEMSPADAAQGRLFVLETPGSYFSWQKKTRPGKGNPITGLTDGDVSDSLFFHNREPVEVCARCELGPVPPVGRELRTIRVCWTLGDSQRSRINVKFAVRDAVTQRWRDISAYLKLDRWQKSMPGSYQIMSLPFPPGAVTGFDAIRLVDAAPLIGVYPTRFTEIDVVTAPAR